MEFLRGALEPRFGASAAESTLAGRPLRALAAMIIALLAAASLLTVHLAGGGAPVPTARGAHMARAGLASLPMSAQGVVSAALGADSPAYRVGPSGDGLAANNPAQRLAIGFSRSGVQLSSGALRVGLSLGAVGRGASLASVASAVPTASGNGARYGRAGLGEWYRNGPLGLEQGFTVQSPPAPARAGALTLSLAISGNARAALAADGHSIVLSHAGGAVLRYGGLAATDARGRSLPSWLELLGGRVLLRVDDRHARYPVRIDPLFQQGPKLTGAGESGAGQLGASAALSADGNTAIVGGPVDNNEVGAAWVFTRTGSTWTQQGPKLTGSGEQGAGNFGYSVALSADGKTALIGGRRDHGTIGAAWVFTSSGSSWTQLGSKLTAGSEEKGEGQFGYRVALSGDGKTALIGAPDDNGGVGAAWAFAFNGSSWEPQGPKVTGSEEFGAAEFGKSVALSNTGETALVGGSADSSALGAAWVFTRTGSTWTQQAKLKGSGEKGTGRIGISAALSSDGNTALVGGGSDNGELGAAWVFVRTESVWAQQGPKLTASEEVGTAHFGFAAALSADGNTALIGGGGDNTEVGAAWEFVRSEATWTQLGSKLTGGGEVGTAHFGYSVALSETASTAIVGGLADNNLAGAAWAFSTTPSPPTVASIAPPSGPAAGGTSVTIHGSGFVAGATVTIGSAATAVNVVSPTEITATTAATPVGPNEVVVSDTNGTSTGGPSYTYTGPPRPTVASISPASGTSVGGTAVKIKGSGFIAGSTVTIGNAATSVVVASSTLINARTSATAAGSYPVVVSNANGTSTGGPSYTYVAPPPPTVTSITPASGTTAGGTLVTIKGTGFVAGATVTIGNVATAVSVNSTAKLSAKTAATAAGTYAVVVSDANGTSSGGPSYTYTTPAAPTVKSVTPTSGPQGGGTSVKIAGTNLTAAQPTVMFGETPAATIVSDTGSSIVVISPSSPTSGKVDVRVTTTGGTSPISKGDAFTYIAPPPPTVTSVTPNTGPAAGGTPVNIKGTGFVNGATVTIGSAATEVVVISETEATATTAATPVGSDEVVVSDINGTSKAGSLYTYE